LIVSNSVSNPPKAVFDTAAFKAMNTYSRSVAELLDFLAAAAIWGKFMRLYCTFGAYSTNILANTTEKT
jgi:hypothetical protein